MSALLIAENPLMVLPSLAVAVGLNEAIVLQQVHYWLTRAEQPREGNRLMGRFQDGRRWIYNNYEDWRAQNFPFWSVSTIRRAIRSLEERKLLESDIEIDLTSPGGKRKWYTINYDKLREIESVHFDQTPYSKWIDPSGQVEQTNNIEAETTSENTQKESLAPPPTASKRPAPSKPKKPAAIKTLTDLDQLHRVVAINSHRIKPGQGINGRTMIRINTAIRDLRERFIDRAVEPDELASAYKWHCALEGNPEAPGESVKICRMVQKYRDANPMRRIGPAVHFPRPMPGCTVCGGADGKHATGILIADNFESVPCPACLEAERASEVSREHAA